MSAAKRRAHAERRIAEARQPWTEYLKAAEWLASELKQFTQRDPAQARGAIEGLFKQTRKFAEDLNRENDERRKA